MKWIAEQLSLILLPTLLAASVPSRALGEDVWLWPIAGLQAGEGIIGQPGEKIGRERNKNTLYISAPEGTPVVCPADALVKYCLLHYQKKSHFSYAFGFNKPFNEALADERDELERLGIDPRYVCVALTLAVDEREIYISGLRCDSSFVSGTMFHRGDTIGTVAYAYHRLSKPCISLSTNMYNLTYDPMMPFGLKSTFRRPHFWRTGERRAVILSAVSLAALLFWLVFHTVYKVKDRRRKAYFQALMGTRPTPSYSREEGEALSRMEEPRESLSSRLAVCRQQFETLPSARVLMTASADDGRTLTADERRVILADVSRTFGDIMVDVKRSSLKVNTQELLLCMLSVMHVPTAVMADCLNVGESTIRTRKTRLKDKMPEELFTMFFSAL